MISSIISRLVILVFGTLYPAYASYKAVRTKNVKEYVKWMMYWIVFALFTCAETFTDVFLSWFPFYYEIKIIIVIWLLSPATKGSSILYRKFVHPTLSNREHEIDEYISKAKEQSYKQVLEIGSKGVTALMQTALKGGGGIMNQLRKSYSLSDLTESHPPESQDEGDISESSVIRKKRTIARVASTSSAIFYSEDDVRTAGRIMSTDDISSGYSSTEALFASPVKVQGREGIVRTGSISRPRGRGTRTGVGKKLLTCDDDNNGNDFFNNQFTHLNVEIENKRRLDRRQSSESPEEFSDSLDMSGNIFEDFNTCNYSCLTAPEEFNNSSENVGIFHGDTNIRSTVTETFQPENHLRDKDKIDRSADERRGGKYNKRAAPSPPLNNSNDVELEINKENGKMIKATLSLEPIVVKSVSTPSDVGDIVKDVTIRVPKSKSFFKKSFITSQKENIKAKLDNSMSKLLNLPRISSFVKSEKGTLLKPLGVDAKLQSRSFNDLYNSPSTRTRPASPNNKIVQYSSSFTVRSLSESPMAKRRIKIIRRYVDQDID